LLGGVLLETVCFTLLAPVLMLFHAKFIALTLAGRGVAWVTQNRDGAGEPGWREVILTHGGQTLLGVVWAALAWWISPTLALWMSPIFLGLVLAMPLSLLTAQAARGARWRERGWLVTPEESQPPPELARLEVLLREQEAWMGPLVPGEEDQGLLQVILDPYANAVHLSLLRDKEPPSVGRPNLNALRQRLLAEGPTALSAREKMSLLQDRASVAALHRDLWSAPTSALSEWWRDAIRGYHLLTPTHAA
jgi:membrane glycosyltransferase